MKKAQVISKPVAILNINSIFTPLYAAVKKLKDAGFMTQEHFESVLIDQNPETLLLRLFPIADKLNKVAFNNKLQQKGSRDISREEILIIDSGV